MSLKIVFLFFVLFSSVYAKVRINSKPGDKVLVRYFHSSDLENELQSKIFNELRKSLKSNSKLLRFKEVNCSLNEDDCQMLSNRTSTSSYLLYERNELVDIYYGQPSSELLRNYCLVQMGFKLPRSLPVPSDNKTPVFEFTAPLLTSKNFNDSVKNNISFVIFFAPWCPHCKKFKPVWNQLTEKYKNNNNISIARVDCEAEQQSHLCFKQKVSGYPTINLYKNGIFYKEYEGGRKMEEITDFIESHQTEEEEKRWEVRDIEREIAYQKKKIEKAERKAAEKAKKIEEDNIAEARKRYEAHKKAKEDKNSEEDKIAEAKMRHDAKKRHDAYKRAIANKKAETDKKCFVEDKHGLCLAT